jgi:exosortase
VTKMLSEESKTRHARLLVLWMLTLVLFRAPLATLVDLSLHDERYSHVIVIPCISGVLVYLRRKTIFAEPRYCTSVGVPLLVLGASICLAAGKRSADSLTFLMAGIVLLWIAGFICCYGIRSFKAGLFPLLFLLLIVPVPTFWLEKAVVFLQRGSAATAYALFRVADVPVLRQGVRLSLPGVEIEVAQQCSSIRSSLSLLITSILTGHLFLSSGWGKLSVIVLTVPVAIFKNAVRIVTISWLGVYVNREFLDGWLHHKGGILFALLGFGIMLTLLWMLQKLEMRIDRKRTMAVQKNG